MSSTRTATAILSQLDATITEHKKFLRGLEQARKAVASAVLDTNGVRRHRAPRASTQSEGPSRVDLVKLILTNASEPMSVSDIIGEMRAKGREDQSNLVHSTLTYLKRKGSVKNPARGQWVAVTEEVAQAA